MTPEEHEILGLKIHLLAQTTLLDFVVDVLRIQYGLQPEPSRLALLSALRRLLGDAGHVVVDLP